ncbi:MULTISPECIES: hypothetical protein [Mycobacterium avium complex (MAC)]|nr:MULTISPECIES: hypothetical protein [Mycobacterium avium complex (MAC)]
MTGMTALPANLGISVCAAAAIVGTETTDLVVAVGASAAAVAVISGAATASRVATVGANAAAAAIANGTATLAPAVTDGVSIPALACIVGAGVRYVRTTGANMAAAAFIGGTATTPSAVTLGASIPAAARAVGAVTVLAGAHRPAAAGAHSKPHDPNTSVSPSATVTGGCAGSVNMHIALGSPSNPDQRLTAATVSAAVTSQDGGTPVSPTAPVSGAVTVSSWRAVIADGLLSPAEPGAPLCSWAHTIGTRGRPPLNAERSRLANAGVIP